MRTGGKPNGIAAVAARCCQVTSRSRTSRTRRRGSSTIVNPNGTRGWNRAASWRALSSSVSGRRRPRECRPGCIILAVSGSSHSAARSSGVAPPAIIHPFHAPAEAPTMMSKWNRSRRAFHTPTSQAPYKPPAERTSAVDMVNKLSAFSRQRSANSHQLSSFDHQRTACTAIGDNAAHRRRLSR